MRNTAAQGAKQSWGGVWRNGVKHAGDHPATHHDYRGGLLAPTLVPVSRHKLHRACLRPVQLEAATADAYGVPTPAAKKRVIGLGSVRGELLAATMIGGTGKRNLDSALASTIITFAAAPSFSSSCHAGRS